MPPFTHLAQLDDGAFRDLLEHHCGSHRSATGNQLVEKGFVRFTQIRAATAASSMSGAPAACSALAATRLSITGNCTSRHDPVWCWGKLTWSNLSKIALDHLYYTPRVSNWLRCLSSVTFRPETRLKCRRVTGT